MSSILGIKKDSLRVRENGVVTFLYHAPIAVNIEIHFSSSLSLLHRGRIRFEWACIPCLIDGDDNCVPNQDGTVQYLLGCNTAFSRQRSAIRQLESTSPCMRRSSDLWFACGCSAASRLRTARSSRVWSLWHRNHCNASNDHITRTAVAPPVLNATRI